MAASGWVMLQQSSNTMLKANEGNVVAPFIAKGVETRLQWQNANYALEFAYDDGFEFEQVMKLTGLNEAQQQHVMSNQGDANRIVIEEVHTLHDNYHEAYYFKGNVLRDKIEFD